MKFLGKTKLLQIKKVVIFLSIILLFGTAQAGGTKRIKKPTIEIGSKASLYVGKDAWLGIGLEVVANPVAQFGVRFNLTELVVGNGAAFYLNEDGLNFTGSSLDNLIYFPLPQIEPYIHTGLGFYIFNPPGRQETHTTLNFRFGIGFKFPVNPRADLFIEPGFVIYSDEIEAMFRSSFGVRFDIF